jgi:predicted nucleic acid-binding protein
MTRYAVDAPTLLHLVASGTPVDGAHQLVATNAVRSQALQLLLDEVRAGRLTEREALDRHDRITELKMRLLGDRVSRRTAWRLALQHGLSIGAAEVLAVATLQADALVTVDSELASTASDVVRLARIGDLTAP